jgi:protein TonB
VVILALIFVAFQTKVVQKVTQQALDYIPVAPVRAIPTAGGGGRPKTSQAPPKTVPKPVPVALAPVTAPITIPTESADTVQALPGAAVSGGVATGGLGNGVGTGTGSGTGPGSGDGTGGAYGIGNGVSSPTVIHEVKPNYTGDAMRAKIQGVAVVECVVRPDGTVDPRSVKITKSIDDRFGLDEEAKKAVLQWRFRPGVRQGVPVPVIVDIELTFTLR